MRKSKFSAQQIAKILKEFDNGKSVDQISREHGVSSAAFYKMAFQVCRNELKGAKKAQRTRTREHATKTDVCEFSTRSPDG